MSGIGVLAGLVFLLVVVLRARPGTTGKLNVRPRDVRPGWKSDPLGSKGRVRYWDGRSWALDTVAGDEATAATWQHPRTRFTPTHAIRAVAIAILVPLIAITPVVTLVAFAVTRIHLNMNLGGSNK
jgi:hypothetical protein